MADEAAIIQKLISDSRQLTEANILKCRSEIILKEITLFKNLSSLCHKSDGDSININPNDSALGKVFQVSVKVLPSPLQQDNGSCNERIVIRVKNVSKSFSLNPIYWQFLVDLDNGKQISSWSLENTLEPEKVESFSMNVFTNHDITPVDLRLRLLFSISHKDQIFSKVLDFAKISIDILYLLSPERVPRLVMYDNTRALELPEFLTKSPKRTVDNTPLPSVTKFFFKFDTELFKLFLENILLSNSKERGFLLHCDSQSDPSFHIYYQEEEISVVPKSSSGKVSFNSPNSRILFALKVAILRRLWMMKNVQVRPLNPNACEKLYGLKLRVEDFCRLDQIPTVEAEDYMDLYLELRDVSELIEFVLVNEVE